MFERSRRTSEQMPTDISQNWDKYVNGQQNAYIGRTTAHPDASANCKMIEETIKNIVFNSNQSQNHIIFQRDDGSRNLLEMGLNFLPFNKQEGL